MPCPRPRVALRGRVPVAYYPADYQKWKAAAAALLVEQLEGREPLEGPLFVSIRCYSERPKTTKLSAPKPDVDNYAKSVLDAMTAAGVWGDDCQVEMLEVSKAWSSEGFIAVTVKQLPEAP